MNGISRLLSRFLPQKDTVATTPIITEAEAMDGPPQTEPMSTEITKMDRAHNTVQKAERIPYGRGSKVHLKYYAEPVFILIEPKGEFWTVLNDRGFVQSVHVNQIATVLIDGHWRNFDGNPRVWRKVY